ncbi:MAG: molybdopterin molybdotransferase MoeA [Firmicutes bacterium]|jgi:molybdopterin molybdotransferase|nr:molybdopterin molybdotransferase MoeA [Bacillota bacterium]
MIEWIELEKARQLIAERGRIAGIEQVGLLEAHGRVLAENIEAPIDHPSFNRSPLDGYALRAEDTAGVSPGSPAELEIIDTIYAGGCSQKKVTAGTTVRLMTGSPIPDGADCVIRQEDVRAEKGRIEIASELTRWENYCFKGESFKKGETVLEKNALLGAAEIGVLAGLGLARVPVFRKPTAAVISTGDELIEPGVEPAPGQVYSSNYYTVACRLKECGVNIVSTGIIGDDRKAIRDAVAEMAGRVDFVITTGGVSVGEKDLIKEVMESLGAEMIFWRVNIKPGSPAFFSVLNGKPVISLSGNPLAAAVTFELLLIPFIRKITGNSASGLTTLQAVLQNDFNKKSPVRRALRGQLTQDESGRALVRIIDPEQSPGNLKVVLDSNCYIDIAEGCSGLKRGELVQVII